MTKNLLSAVTATLLAGVVHAGNVTTGSISPQKPDSRHPNIIYIYADDMGLGMISACGQRQFTTPNIDRLVRQGTSFNRAYGCMLSAPARASLLTGYHDCHGRDKWNISSGGVYLGAMLSTDEHIIPHMGSRDKRLSGVTCTAADTVRIASFEAGINAKDVYLPEGDLYLAQVFRAAGYTTAQIGKLEYGFTATRKQMRRHGWDYYYGYLDHVRCHGFYPPFLFDNGSIEFIEGNTRMNSGRSVEQETAQTMAERRDRTGKDVYSQDIFVDKILNYIRAHKDERFFLYHPSQLPHGPVAIPAIHPELAANPNLTPIEREYGSMVKKLDETVGLILAEIEETGIADRTVVIFSADNGHELYYQQKGRCVKNCDLNTGIPYDNLTNKYRSETGGDIFNGNAGMAGLKRSNLEGGVHIPLVFYCPGIIPEGRQSDALVSNYDFLPTMADWLKVEVKGKDGVSFLPQLLKGKEQKNHRYVVFGSQTGPGIVTADGWKLRHYLSKKAVELFYLPDDPQERHDLSGKYPEKVEELKRILLEECGGDLKRGANCPG